MSNTVNGSRTYSYTEGIKGGYEYDGIFHNFSVELSFSATQALQSGWSNSNATTQSYTNEVSNTRTIPPYSEAIMETGKSDIEVTTRYNCPVGLVYSVDILTDGTGTWNPDTDPDAAGWTGKKYTFGPDARKDIYQRWMVDGGNFSDGNKGLDPQKIDWFLVTFGRVNQNSLMIDQQWLKYRLSERVPISSAGAVIKETKKSTSTSFKEFIPIYPLKLIKLEAPPNVSAFADKISYDNYGYLQMTMQIGKSSYTKYFDIKGYNQFRGEYCLFNKDFGHWIVVDENDNELGEDAPVVLDNDSGTTRFKAVRPGKCYLKYLIDEDAYTSAETGEAYTKNSDLTSTAIMEITVQEPEYKNKLEVTGSYNGYVGAAAESIEGDGKLEGCILDETGAEVDEDYIWNAKQLPKKGINLAEDGTVSFTKEGTFQVRIMTPDKKHYSDWVDITAESLGDDDDIDIVDDADYHIAKDDNVLFIDGSFEGTVGADAVSIEGENKLTVYAEDVTGAEHPVVYEWESAAPDAYVGMDLTEDGHVSFSEPGSYLVRVRSGAVCSDWVEITAKEPAIIKREPVANSRVYDGEIRNLIEPGVAVYGNMAYIVLKDDSVPPESAYDYASDEIPAAAEPGTYYVWYKAVGDSKHGDSRAKRVKVMILLDKDKQAAEIKKAKAVKAALSSVTAKKSRKAIVKWKKKSDADGYQLQYSTSSKFTRKTTKTVNISKATTVKKTLTKLKKGKKYYFRIRTYKKIYDPADYTKKAFYGKWSKVKTATVK
jgi:hypothetical protein